MFITLTETGSHLRNGSVSIAVRADSILTIRPHLEGARLLLAPGVLVDVQESMADTLAIIESKKGAA
jgi:hypothetical protein